MLKFTSHFISVNLFTSCVAKAGRHGGPENCASILFYYTSTILQTFVGLWDKTQGYYKTTNFRQCHGTICIVKVFLLSERGINRNYTGIFLDFFNSLFLFDLILYVPSTIFQL